MDPKDEFDEVAVPSGTSRLNLLKIIFLEKNQ